jgi:antitoxin CptB
LDSVDSIADIGRMRWRCRRGTRELDRLLDWWLRERFPHEDAAGRAAFDALLDSPDPDLWNWLIGQEKPTDIRFARIVDEIRAQHRI